MQLDEQTRHEVFGTLRDKLGETAAVVLMGAIPPSAWAEYPTRTEIATMLTAVEDRFTGRMYRAMFFQTLGLFGANVALISAFAR